MNYLTTNIGTTPYPNSSTITMTSPVYSFTNCLANLTITFPINGRIESGFDFMSFQYFNAGAWVTVATHTGIRNNVLYSYVIPNTVTQFRFRLVTDATVNSYGFPFTNVYYYDIDYFNISCSSVLSIELIYFDGINKDDDNIISWVTETETNNNYYTLEQAIDAISWKPLAQIGGSGTTNTPTYYKYVAQKVEPTINYYRLKQTDFDGTYTYSAIISIDNSKGRGSVKEIVNRTNLLGQQVEETYQGVQILYYKDGTTKKVLPLLTQ